MVTTSEVAVVKNCKEDKLGLKYNGTTSTTKSGRTCQRWDSQYPHPHVKHKKEAENYCRNPDGEPEGPWCYTKSIWKRWEYCDIPICGISFQCLHNALLVENRSPGAHLLHCIHMEALGILCHSYLRYVISMFISSLLVENRFSGTHGAILRPYGSAGIIVTFLSVVFHFNVYMFTAGGE